VADVVQAVHVVVQVNISNKGMSQILMCYPKVELLELS